MTEREELREFILNAGDSLSELSDKAKKRLKTAGKIAAGAVAVGAGVYALKKGMSPKAKLARAQTRQANLLNKKDRIIKKAASKTQDIINKLNVTSRKIRGLSPK